MQLKLRLKLAHLRAQGAVARHVLAVPDVAPVGGQLEVAVDVHGQPCLRGQRQEAVGSPLQRRSCLRRLSSLQQAAAVEPGGDARPGHESQVRVLGRGRDERGRAAAQLVADEPLLHGRLLHGRAVRLHPPCPRGRHQRTTAAAALALAAALAGDRECRGARLHLQQESRWREPLERAVTECLDSTLEQAVVE